MVELNEFVDELEMFLGVSFTWDREKRVWNVTLWDGRDYYIGSGSDLKVEFDEARNKFYTAETLRCRLFEEC